MTFTFSFMQIIRNTFDQCDKIDKLFLQYLAIGKQ